MGNRNTGREETLAFANGSKEELREIPRNPSVPELSSTIIDLLAKLCFRKDDELQKADLLFVFSSSTELAKIASNVHEILNSKLTDRVFITGGSPNFTDSNKISDTECAAQLAIIHPQNFPETEFFTEDKSVSTLTNVTEALKVYDFRTLDKIIFLFKSHAAGRGYLTLRKFLPKARILQRTYARDNNSSNFALDHDNWYKFDFGRRRVWGEYLRIKKYGERDDIAFEEVKDLVYKIWNLIGN